MKKIRLVSVDDNENHRWIDSIAVYDNVFEVSMVVVIIMWVVVVPSSGWMTMTMW